MPTKKTIRDATDAAQQWPTFLLASMLTSYADDDFADNVAAFLDEKWILEVCAEVDGDRWEALRRRLAQIVGSGDPALDEIRSDYIDVFDRGQASNPLYESEYGRQRALQKSNILADLAGFYRAFGVSTSAEHPEMHDHISVELEFYSYLLMKQAKLAEEGDEEGYDIVLEARKKFLTDHLGALAEAVRTRPGVVENEYFQMVFSWCSALLRRECEALDVAPHRLTWEEDTEPEAMACGAAACGVS